MQSFKVKKLDLEEVNASFLSLKKTVDKANETAANTFIVLNSYLSVLQSNFSTLQSQYARLIYYKTIFERVLKELEAADPEPEEEDE